VALWRWLEAADLIVPTTGRTPEQLKRVTLEFHGPSVCLQGAVILDSTRSVDASWWAKIHAQSQVCRAELQTLMQRLGTLCSGHGVQIQSVSHDGMPLFLTLRSLSKGSDVVWRNVDLAVRSALAEQAAYRNWSVRQDTRRLHVLPPHIGKEHAVQHLLNVLNPTLSMGVGHSDADRPFMVRCDAFIEVNANIAPGQN
jgi:predicted mannosyl-3-phosphoglycerate phosphatase (HAD superfamily)